MVTVSQLTRLTALVTLIVVVLACMRTKALARAIMPNFYHKHAFAKSCHDFYSWATQVLFCCVTAAYSAGSTDNSEELPFSRVILQACRICTKINQFYYPNVALAFVTIYWNLQENYTSYYVGTNLIFLCLSFVKAYVFVQDFSIPTWPDNVVRHIIALLQVALGMKFGNWWIVVGGAVVICSISISPPYAFTRSLPFSCFKAYLLGMSIGSVCQAIGFCCMLEQVQSDQQNSNDQF